MLNTEISSRTIAVQITLHATAINIIRYTLIHTVLKKNYTSCVCVRATLWRFARHDGLGPKHTSVKLRFCRVNLAHIPYESVHMYPPAPTPQVPQQMSQALSIYTTMSRTSTRLNISAKLQVEK